MGLNLIKELYADYVAYEKEKIPLCAAETYVSHFVKQALPSIFEGKYAMGLTNKTANDDFIGSKYIFRLFDLLRQECLQLFGAKYADARTLSGMNCITTVLMALKRGCITPQKVVLTMPQHGGHASVPHILESLNYKYIEMPYDEKAFQIDYETLNALIKNECPNMLIFCQSDLLQPPDFTRINTPPDTCIIYDCTQTFGLIAGKVLPNPLLNCPNMIMIGGTHKTLPSVTCGLILTNNDEYINCLEYAITPLYIRNVQPNNIASVLLSLIELEQVGVEYQNAVVASANVLGGLLERKFSTTYADQRFKIAKINDDIYSKTHQVFILSDEVNSLRLYKNAIYYNVTLNKKHKRLFGEHQWGIRLGVQEIARYGWQYADFDMLSDIIVELSKKQIDTERLFALKNTLLSKKSPKFLLEDFFMDNNE